MGANLTEISPFSSREAANDPAAMPMVNRAMKKLATVSSPPR